MDGGGKGGGLANSSQGEQAAVQPQKWRLQKRELHDTFPHSPSHWLWRVVRPWHAGVKMGGVHSFRQGCVKPDPGAFSCRSTGAVLNRSPGYAGSAIFSTVCCAWKVYVRVLQTHEHKYNKVLRWVRLCSPNERIHNCPGEITQTRDWLIDWLIDCFKSS